MSRVKCIEELNNRELSGRLLDIWEGRSGLAPNVEETYRNLWREQAGKEPKIEPCRFHGKPTGETIDCTPCGGRVRFKVFECSHPKLTGVCTLEMADPAVPNCRDCHWKNRDKEPPPMPAAPTPDPDQKTIAVSFTHGLGDAANFAHMIPLYTRRGYRVQVHCGHADHAPLFRAAGAEIVGSGESCHWPEAWGRNKNWNNLNRPPLPIIGDPAELWREYVDVRLDFAPQVCEADRLSVDQLLANLPRPIVAMHVRGFAWGDNSGEKRSYPDASTVRLVSTLLGAKCSIIMLDRDSRAPRIDDTRVRYFHDYSPGQLYEILARVEVFAGIDSGPLNFVRFTQTPAVGIWVNHHPTGYALPRPETRHVVANRHADSDAIAATEWNTVLAPDDGPSPATVAREILRAMNMDAPLKGLRSTSFGRAYYEEHAEAGLDYLGYGDWQQQYGRWLIDVFGLKGKTVLDVGCACGAIVRGLSEAGAVVQGIDVNEHAVNLGRERWPDMRAMLRVCDAANLHLYSDGEWDAIHSAQVAEHWPPHLVPIILRELARVTKPGGVLFCCLDTTELFERQGRKMENEDPTHVCVQPMAWWTEQLAAAGWNVTRDYDAALASHPESFLSRYDWDWFVARKA